MGQTDDRPKPHPFSALPGFDDAMRKIVEVPKDEIQRREDEARAARAAERDR